MDWLTQFYNTHSRRFVQFIIVGIGNTLIYFSLFLLLFYWIHLSNFDAVTIAYFTSAVYQFLANRRLTFELRSPKHIIEVAKYVVLLILNYVIAVTAMHFALLMTGSTLVGLLLTSAIATPMGYLVFRFWIFPEQKHSYHNSH